jgi:hypothetical protein
MLALPNITGVPMANSTIVERLGAAPPITSWASQPSSLFLAAACLFLGYHILTKISTKDTEDAKIWSSLPTLGVPSSTSTLNILPIPWRLLARLRSVTATQKLVHDGYYQYHKGANGRPFALPTMWTGTGVVVLPPSMIPILNRPRDELSSFDALLDTVRLRETMPDPSVWGNTFHFDVVRRDLNLKNVGSVAAETAAELEYAMRLGWGTGGEGWRTVKAWDAGVRIMIGLPLCRDDELVEDSLKYVEGVVMDSVLMNCIPQAFRSILGRVSALRAKYHKRRVQKKLLPLVEERIRLWREAKEGDELPNDTLQWLIPRCAEIGPEEVDAQKIMMRHLSLTTMFLYGISWGFVHALVDIYTDPSADEVVAALRAECEPVSQSLQTVQTVDRLHRTDSALRESMRVSDVMVHFLNLDVIGGDGIDLGNGIRIPAGSKVRSVFPTQAINLDPDNYPDPERFDAFRFLRKFEEDEEKEGQATGKRELMATCTPTYLTFGYGRHVCPGRFILAQMVKQALGKMVVNYDVEIVRGRPEKRQSILKFMLPPQEVQIKVRRRG